MFGIGEFGSQLFAGNSSVALNVVAWKIECSIETAYQVLPAAPTIWDIKAKAISSYAVIDKNVNETIKCK